jgi:hypothetical protein
MDCDCNGYVGVKQMHCSVGMVILKSHSFALLFGNGTLYN